MINLTDNELKFLLEEVNFPENELKKTEDYEYICAFIMSVEVTKGFGKHEELLPFYYKAQNVFYGISDRYYYYNGEIRDTDYYDQYLRENGDIT